MTIRCFIWIIGTVFPSRNDLLNCSPRYSLSRLGLKCKDLPVKLLSRLRSLESWDLSGNMLEELPRGLALPRLRSLDLSANEMEDVTTLDSLTSLEELKLEGNIYMTVRKKYMKTILPFHPFSLSVLTC